MASQNVTLNGPYEFEADGTERIAILSNPGGYLINTGSADAVVNVNGDGSSTGLVTTAQPSGANQIRVQQGNGILIPLPRTCSFFNFKAASSTFLQYIQRA